MQTSQGQLRDAVLQQYTRLQQDLAASDVLELPAGVPHLLRSSAVLLKGTLKVSGRHYLEGRKGQSSRDFPRRICRPHHLTVFIQDPHCSVCVCVEVERILLFENLTVCDLWLTFTIFCAIQSSILEHAPPMKCIPDVAHMLNNRVS